MANILRRFLKFAGTGVVGSIVDTLVLWLLSDHVFSGGYWSQYMVSPVISFQCAVAVNYTISYFYVWKDRTRKAPDASLKRFLKLYLIYDLSASGVFLIRLCLLLLVERITGWDVVLCNLAAMCFSGLVNFTINNMVIFKKKESKKNTD